MDSSNVNLQTLNWDISNICSDFPLIIEIHGSCLVSTVDYTGKNIQFKWAVISKYFNEVQFFSSLLSLLSPQVSYPLVNSNWSLYGNRIINYQSVHVVEIPNSKGLYSPVDTTQFMKFNVKRMEDHLVKSLTSYG